jgi:beta-glucosidase
MPPIDIDRRALIAAGALAATAGAAHAATRAPAPARPAFLWGTAGAAYQVEGGNSASDVWALEHIKPTYFVEPSGDAADVYNRIDQDLAYVASLGFNCHRFSIEWSRIEPEQGQISYAGLDYYRRVLETCHRHKLAPVVTYNHNSVPRWFAAAGGFETPDGILPFVGFCDLVTRHMGDLISVAATLNEPNVNALLNWIPQLQAGHAALAEMRRSIAANLNAPRWSSPIFGDFHIQQPIMLEAHARAYDAIKTASGGKIPVGVTLAINDDLPPLPESGLASGVEAKRAQILTPWLNAPGDWVGVQNYTESRVGPTADLPNAPGVEVTQMDYPFAPRALEAVIRTLAGLTKRPIYVTENGVATEDDTRRVAFIREAVRGVLAARADGVDVRSYIHWSLLDNFEWTNGYRPKFGLVAVDRKTFKRTPKPSAAYFGQIARTGRVA